MRLRNKLSDETTYRGTKRSANDTNRHLELLRAVFNYAVLNEWLSVNPLSRANILLRANKSQPRFFSDEEIERILLACVEPIEHIKPMIEFALLTGCRTAEMLMLKWEDVDFEGSRIHFRNTKTAQDRFVKMGLELRHLLHTQPRFEGCEYVFPNPRTNQPFGHWSEKYRRFFPQFPRKAWELIRKRANLTDAAATPYTFRRTAATTLVKSLGLHEAQEILGHADIATTRVYAAVTSDTYDRAAEVLERKVKRANGGER